MKLADDSNRRYDYPLNSELIEALKLEYRQEAITKGDSWNNPDSLEFLLRDKIPEEYKEVYECIFENTCGYGNYPKEELREEIKDLILVLAMAYRVLEK